MGKLILLIIVCFGAYWAWQTYKEGQKKKEDNKTKPIVNQDGHESVDALMAYYNRKISEIESKSVEEIKRSQELLDLYKKELDKINNLKK